MSLRITAILLAVLSPFGLPAADDGSERSPHAPATTVGILDLIDPLIDQIREARRSGKPLGLLRPTQAYQYGSPENADSLFNDNAEYLLIPSHEFPFSPRPIRQFNYGTPNRGETLVFDGFPNPGHALPLGNTTAAGTSLPVIIPAAGTSDGGANVIERAVAAACDAECSRCTDADECPIEVVFAEDGDADCGEPSIAHSPEPPPVLPNSEAAIPPSASFDSVLGHPPGLWLQTVDANNHVFVIGQRLTAGCTAPEHGCSFETSAQSGFIAAYSSTSGAAPGSSASDACSHAEPPLKAKVEHLLEAARHLAGAGYEDEAKLFRVEAEAIQNASTRLLTEKRQELERLQLEITELEELTGQYQAIQLSCQVLELSVPEECRSELGLDTLLTPGIHVLGHEPQTMDCPAVAYLSTEHALLNALKTLHHHPRASMKTIAQPVLLTRNGTAASFHSGGEFPILIPVGAENGASKSQTSIEWRDFGVELQAVPFIMGNGKVRLSLVTEVADRDFKHARQLNGIRVPGLTTRRFRSDVETRFGDVVVIACNSPNPAADGTLQTLLVLVTARQIEPQHSCAADE